MTAGSRPFSGLVYFGAAFFDQALKARLDFIDDGGHVQGLGDKFRLPHRSQDQELIDDAVDLLPGGSAGRSILPHFVVGKVTLMSQHPGSQSQVGEGVLQVVRHHGGESIQIVDEQLARSHLLTQLLVCQGQRLFHLLALADLFLQDDILEMVNFRLIAKPDLLVEKVQVLLAFLRFKLTSFIW
jgi:hypothetical protein